MLVPVRVDNATNEWSLIEFQGELVSGIDSGNSGDHLANVEIGTLRYVNGVPTLRIGNHILAGKVGKLPKPFAILEKVEDEDEDMDGENVDDEVIDVKEKVARNVRKMEQRNMRPPPVRPPRPWLGPPRQSIPPLPPPPLQWTPLHHPPLPPPRLPVPFHTPNWPYGAPRPQRLHPPLPSAAPVDPDTQWLETFKRMHLPSNDNLVQLAQGKTEYQQPPLQEIRNLIALAQELTTQLKKTAMEVVAIETRLSSPTLPAMDPLELSRLKLQRDRKRAHCEKLKAELESMNAVNLFVPSDRMIAIKSFAKHVQRKKNYRRKVRAHRRASVALRQAMLQNSAPQEKNERREDNNNSKLGMDPIDHKADNANDTKDKQKERARARLEAQKVLLLLAIKEQRQGTHQLPNEDRIMMDQMKEEALKYLAPTKKPRTPRNTSDVSQEPDKPLHIEEKKTPETLLSSDELLDPETITMKTLITVRRAWDRYIVFPRTPGASAIPPHYVVPPVKPSGAWGKYLHTQ